ncbi:MAG: helix-turn-helix domain-containing protein [Patescibacteria group bacterium]|jgi:sugar-specific transcriptional regulator TrmB
MTTVSKLFSSLGLSRKSEQVYEAVIKHGPVSAGSLAQILDMPRATVYFELGILRQRGLISTSGSHSKQKFIAEKPERIVQLVKEKVNFFADLLPQAETASKKLTEEIYAKRQIIPEIRFYTGADGIKKVLDSTLGAYSKQVKGILPSYDIYMAMGEKYMRDLVNARVKKGIRVRNIWPKKNVPEFLRRHQEQLRDVRLAEEIDLPSAIITFDEYVIFITSTKELFSLQIKSPDLARTISYLFELMWRGAE